MAYPTGMSLVTVTAGSALDFAGTDRPISVAVRPVLGGNATRLIWEATGQPVVDGQVEYTAEAGSIASFTVPNPDQDGFIDGSGNAVRMWSYHATVTVGQNRWTQAFQPIAGQTNIDLDLVPDGQVTAPTSAPLPLVTSVNGQTGAVVIETGGGGGTGNIVVLDYGEPVPEPPETGVFYLRVVEPSGNVAPSILTQPQSNTVTVGGSVTLTSAAAGQPEPTAQWQLNTGSGWANISGATDPTLVIASVALGQNGHMYRVIYANTLGSVTSNTATLTVTEAPVDPPAVTQSPTSQSVTEGTAVTFTAAATGQSSTQWQINTGTGWSDIPGANAGSYTIASPTVAQSGYQYRCVFSNSGGTVYTSIATLTVTVEPVEPGTITRTLVSIPTAGNFTTSAASLVEALATVDGVYITSGASEQTQLFGTIATPNAAGTINSVTVKATARLAEAGGRNLTCAIRPGGSTTNYYYPTTSVVDSTDWTEYTWTFTENPATTLPWAVGEVNGISRVYIRVSDDSGLTEVHIDQVLVEIDHGA